MRWPPRPRPRPAGPASLAPAPAAGGARSFPAAGGWHSSPPGPGPHARARAREESPPSAACPAVRSGEEESEQFVGKQSQAAARRSPAARGKLVFPSAPEPSFRTSSRGYRHPPAPKCTRTASGVRGRLCYPPSQHLPCSLHVVLVDVVLISFPSVSALSIFCCNLTLLAPAPVPERGCRSPP